MDGSTISNANFVVNKRRPHRDGQKLNPNPVFTSKNPYAVGLLNATEEKYYEIQRIWI